MRNEEKREDNSVNDRRSRNILHTHHRHENDGRMHVCVCDYVCIYVCLCMKIHLTECMNVSYFVSSVHRNTCLPCLYNVLQSEGCLRLNMLTVWEYSPT